MPSSRRTLSLVLAGALAVSAVATSAPAWAETPSPTPVPTPEPTATSTPAATPTDPGRSDTSLERALQRDLKMTTAQFRAAAARARVAAQIAAELQGEPGFERVYLRGSTIVVVGTGERVAAVAAKHGATVTATGIDADVPSTRGLLQRYLREVGGEGLVSIGQTATGYVIRVKDPQRVGATRSAAQFAAQFDNVTVEQVKTGVKAVEDVYDGQGIQTNEAYTSVCSLGFNAYNPSGARAVITAGHCGEGKVGVQVVPRTAEIEPAMGGRSGWDGSKPVLGTYDYALYGNGFPDGVGTDFATIGSITSGYTLRPWAMKWQDSGAAGKPFANPVRVTGTLKATIGMPICRSGRTTGWHCGTLTDIGVVALSNADGTEVRYIDSAISEGLIAQSGDSGGTMISGNKAVGVTSGGGGDASTGYIATFALLLPSVSSQAETMTSLADVRPGYQVQLWLNNPRATGAAMTSATVGTASWRNGQTVTGTVPPEAGDTIAPGTKLQVLVDGAVKTTVAVASNGTYSFSYPGTLGTHTVVLRAVNGYSRSADTTLTVTTPSTVYGDQNADGVADLVTIGLDGHLRTYYGATTASGPTFTLGVDAGAGWDGYSWMGMVPDMNNDGWTDMVVREPSTGYLSLLYGRGYGQFGGKTPISGNFNGIGQLTVMPDITRDGVPDMVGIRLVDKTLYRWNLTAVTGRVQEGVQIGHGWDAFTSLTTIGDNTNDGVPDLLGNTSTQILYRYPMTWGGTINAAPKSFGPGWNARWIFSPGDLTRDGRRDLMLLRADGKLFFYANTGTGVTTYSAVAGDWTGVRMVG